MSEEDLIKHGFEKVVVTDEESQNGYDYFFYVKEYCEGITLHSTDSTDVKDDNWTLSSFEIPAIEISKKDHLIEFTQMLNNIICK